MARDRDAQQRVEGLDGGRALGAGRGQVGVGGGGLGQHALVVEGQPGASGVDFVAAVWTVRAS